MKKSSPQQLGAKHNNNSSNVNHNFWLGSLGESGVLVFSVSGPGNPGKPKPCFLLNVPSGGVPPGILGKTKKSITNISPTHTLQNQTRGPNSRTKKYYFEFFCFIVVQFSRVFVSGLYFRSLKNVSLVRAPQLMHKGRRREFSLTFQIRFVSRSSCSPWLPSMQVHVRVRKMLDAHACSHVHLYLRKARCAYPPVRAPVRAPVVFS